MHVSGVIVLLGNLLASQHFLKQDTSPTVPLSRQVYKGLPAILKPGLGSSVMRATSPYSSYTFFYVILFFVNGFNGSGLFSTYEYM